jgi:hypothetical protein
MRRRDWLMVCCAGLVIALVAGCGGGSGGGGNPGGSGSISIGVLFPADGGAGIPSNAESVRVQVLGAKPPGAPLVPDAILNKPPGGGLAQSKIRGVPVGSVVVKAIAHPQRDGLGPALADAQASAQIIADRTTSVTLTLVAIVDRVSADPDHLEMLVGEREPVVAHALDAVGAVIIGAPVDLSSDDPSVATVESNSMVHALAIGSTVVRARHAASGKEALVTVDVVPARIARVEVTVTPPATVIGHAVQFSALAYDDLGQPRPWRKFDWRVLHPADGAIDGSGRFTPRRTGRLEVVATERSSGVEGVGLVTVADWVVLLEWASGADADLHVFDTTQTTHAYFGETNVWLGTLFPDAIAGPGIEAFAGNKGTSGRYPVAVNYFRGRGSLSAGVTLLTADGPETTFPINLTAANGDDGYPVTVPTASWARPFDAVVATDAITAQTPDTSIALGPPGSRVK